jgi:L-cysteine desulfidase
MTAWIDFTAIVGVFILGIFIAVIGYLLSKKDAHQENMIDALFKKHDEDASRLQTLEIKIAETHYQKPEVDRLFDKFKGYLDEKFTSIESILKDKT